MFCYSAGQWSHSLLLQKSLKGRGLTLMYVQSRLLLTYMVTCLKAALLMWVQRPLLGYPQEKDGERSSGAADSHRCSLWTEEERGRGADWPQRPDCEMLCPPINLQNNREERAVCYSCRGCCVPGEAAGRASWAAACQGWKRARQTNSHCGDWCLTLCTCAVWCPICSEHKVLFCHNVNKNEM